MSRSEMLGSRFHLSHSGMRRAVKEGKLPSAEEQRAYGRPPEMSRREFQRRQRWSLRRIRVHEKSLPMFDMDGSFFHEF